MKQTIKNTPEPGTIIKKELKDRRISQKDFAKVMGVTPTYLCDLLGGRRRFTVQLAMKTEELLGISSRAILGLQNALDLIKRQENPAQCKDMEATEIIRRLKDKICVRTLLKSAKQTFGSITDQLRYIGEIIAPENPTDLQYVEERANAIGNGFFRKSSLTGLDSRMINTWVLLAYKESTLHHPVGTFSLSNATQTCARVCDILHKNHNTLHQLYHVLSEAGIGLLRVDKVERASIDGFSFFRNGIPYIALTCRFDRIDNLAFTLMHELGHLYLGHTTDVKSNLNIDTRSFDEDENREYIEAMADRFAGDCLIPPVWWQFAPTVTSNPMYIQKRYTQWAKGNGLNPWIVLGRLSHETGMYKFKSDNTRAIHGGKGGADVR